MNYIYCITNLINNKRYVGKTTQLIEERFREHCKDSQKERCEKRPLYDAMNKYGIENFKVECLEEIDDPAILSEREIYWIKELGTYGSNGPLKEEMALFFTIIRKLFIQLIQGILVSKLNVKQDVVRVLYTKY